MVNFPLNSVFYLTWWNIAGCTEQNEEKVHFLLSTWTIKSHEHFGLMHFFLTFGSDICINQYSE
jgi:hypothetical protein